MDNSAFAIFSAVVSSIVLEAAPFLLLGSLLSAFIGVYAGQSAFTGLARRPLPVQIAAGLLAGVALPTCECGVVPVTRGLLRKGAPAGAAIPFMLAAPVVNPVSVASTWMAFQGGWEMAAWRVGLALVPAAMLGWVLGAGGTPLLRPGLDMAHDACGCGCGHDHDHARPKLLAGIPQVLRSAGREFLDMALFLILGACAAALFKVFLPQELLAAVSGSLWTAVPAMMLLAVLMSVCSEADAFVAASLSMFPAPALLGFLTLGPMLDLKLIPALLAVFRKPAALTLILAPAAALYLLIMGLGLAGVLP